MPNLPPGLPVTELDLKLERYLGKPRQGKVRNTYTLPGLRKLLLVRATDRISIFDFILNAHVWGKGATLTAMTVLWLAEVFTDIPHHLIAYGSGIDKWLPEDLRGNIELQQTCIVVLLLDMVKIECIFRGFLTGSGWKSYRDNNRELCGYTLPEGLHDGSKLPDEFFALFTPTDKSEEGHDKELPAGQVIAEYGTWIAEKPREVYMRGFKYAAMRGLILADTKLEYGLGGVLADEVLTPDSSRLWKYSDWVVADEKGKSPSGFDKQPVRDYGSTISTPFMDEAGKPIKGLGNLEPEISEHREFVHSLVFPSEVLNAATPRYSEAFQILADGRSLEVFWDTAMHIG